MTYNFCISVNKQSILQIQIVYSNLNGKDQETPLFTVPYIRVLVVLTPNVCYLSCCQGQQMASKKTSNSLVFASYVSDSDLQIKPELGSHKHCYVASLSTVPVRK